MPIIMDPREYLSPAVSEETTLHNSSYGFMLWPGDVMSCFTLALPHVYIVVLKMVISMLKAKQLI
jgi:hypothetical protein